MADTYFGPYTGQDGSTQQSAMPKKIPGHEAPYRARGAMYRGVVVQTYTVDADGQTGGGSTTEAALQSSNLSQDAGPPAVYCDVLTYSILPGAKDRLLTRVLVSNNRGGLHNGRVWIPRPAQLNIGTGRRVSLDALGTISKSANPADLDGDHVLVGFMDDDLGLPVIISGIPHPSADIGNEQYSGGNRTKLRAVDGEPDYQRHNGVVYGVSGSGDFEVNTRSAHRPNYKSTGEEPDADGDTAATGNVTFELQPGAEFRVAGLAATITLRDDGTLDISSGTGDMVQTFRMKRSGEIELSQWPGNIQNETTSLIFTPDGNVELDLGRDLSEPPQYSKSVTIRAGTQSVTITNDATITVNGTYQLNSDDISLGNNATEAAVLGDQLRTILSALTVSTALGPSGTPINVADFQNFLAQIVKVA